MPRPDQRFSQIMQVLEQLHVSLEGLRTSLASVVQATTDHEQRLRSVERFQHALTPTLAAITFILGVASKAAIEQLF